MEEKLRRDLLDWIGDDDTTRDRLAETGELSRGYHPEMEAVHRRNAGRLAAVVAAHGWPGRTLVGVDGVSRTGLLSEDGALEVRPGGFTIEPFVQVGPAVTTWADAEVSQSLEDGYLPVPSVTWRARDFDLTVTAIGQGAPGGAGLVGRYRLRNRGDRTLAARLVLAARGGRFGRGCRWFLKPEHGLRREVAVN